MKTSYLFLPFLCRKAIFDPSSDQAGSSTFFVDVHLLLFALFVHHGEVPRAVGIDDHAEFLRRPSERVAGQELGADELADGFPLERQREHVLALRLGARGRDVPRSRSAAAGVNASAARSPPIGVEVAASFCSPCLMSMPNVFEPGANLFDFHVQ